MLQSPSLVVLVVVAVLEAVVFVVDAVLAVVDAVVFVVDAVLAVVDAVVFVVDAVLAVVEAVVFVVDAVLAVVDAVLAVVVVVLDVVEVVPQAGFSTQAKYAAMPCSVPLTTLQPLPFILVNVVSHSDTVLCAHFLPPLPTAWVAPIITP